MNFQDLRQTKEWGIYLSSIGWVIEEIRNPKSEIRNFLYIRRLPLIPFSIAKLQRPSGKIDFERLDEICRRNKVMVLYFEPGIYGQEHRAKSIEQFGRNGFRRSKIAHLPQKTIWIDLRKTEKQLLNEMKAKTRYNIGLAKRKGLRAKIVDGEKLIKSPLLFNSFFEHIKKNARRLGIFSMPKKWFEAQVKAFEKQCFVVLVYSSRLGPASLAVGSKNGLLAGNFFMVSQNACFYSHNGSSKLGRKLMAPSLCAWEGILEAKKRGLKIFDFDGIYDGSWSLRRWKGFSRFKKGFGGKEMEFVGQFSKWLWPYKMKIEN